MGELSELCNPLVEFIKENYNPYTEIVVTMDSITVKQKAERIPVEDFLEGGE
ncbi:MAG: hypothetical protein ACI4TA_04405 [Acetatifactor sp.]